MLYIQKRLKQDSKVAEKQVKLKVSKSLSLVAPFDNVINWFKLQFWEWGGPSKFLRLWVFLRELLLPWLSLIPFFCFSPELWIPISVSVLWGSYPISVTLCFMPGQHPFFWIPQRTINTRLLGTIASFSQELRITQSKTLKNLYMLSPFRHFKIGKIIKLVNGAQQSTNSLYDYYFYFNLIYFSIDNTSSDII